MKPVHGKTYLFWAELCLLVVEEAPLLWAELWLPLEPVPEWAPPPPIDVKIFLLSSVMIACVNLMISSCLDIYKM